MTGLPDGLLDRVHVSADDVEDALESLRWTDGLPVRVPTPEHMEAFLAASGMDPALEIGPVAPLHGLATVANVAVNAYMAGCRPHHLPLVVASVASVVEEPFNLYAVQCTTNPVTPMVLVNGPRRGKFQINCLRGAGGPGPYANGVVGRALRLVLGNLGGSFDDNVDMANHGSPLKYTFCVGEAEEHSPWEPLHVSRGFRGDDDVVTTAAVEGLIDIIPSYGNTQSHHLVDHIGRAMRTLGTCYYWSQGNPVLILNPTHAAILDSAGIDRRRLQELLFEEARIPLDSMPYGNIPVGDWTVVDGKVLGFQRPDDIVIAVAGPEGGHHSLYGMGFCLSFVTSALVPAV